VIDLEISNLSSMKLTIMSYRHLSEHSFWIDYVYITEAGSHSFSFSSHSLQLWVDSTLDDTLTHKIVVTGQYRINRGEWQALELQDCHPKKLIIFSGEGYLYNLSLDLRIIELTALLQIKYISISSDAHYLAIAEEGNTSVNITASRIKFGLLDNGTGQVGQIAGWYKIVTSDRILIPRYNFLISWEVFVILPVLISGYLRRKIKTR